MNISQKLATLPFTILAVFSLPLLGCQDRGPVQPLSGVQNTSAAVLSLPENQVKAAVLPSPESQAVTSTTVYLPFIQGTTPTPPPSSGMIANDTVISQFAAIPKTYVDAAAAKSVLFMHQSTGEIIAFWGLGCLAGLHSDPDFPPECATYAQNPNYYNYSNWDWILWPEPMANAPEKMKQFVAQVNTRQSGYEIIGMKFCYVDGWNQDFAQYRDKMEQLEAAYPSKTFIWATSAIWAEPGTACNPGELNSCKNMSDFNQQLRAYAKTNNKPLYDIAAIESDGGSCMVEGYEGMCLKYNDGGGGHPNKDGSIRLAKGFWWLMARLSGWNP